MTAGDVYWDPSARNAAKTRQEVLVSKWYQHHDFDMAKLRNDMCLMRLQRELKIGKGHHTAVLKTGSPPPVLKPGVTKCTVAGWGTTEAWLLAISCKN